MNKAEKVLLPLALGLAAGVITGILYAPEKGAETRRKLGKLKNRLKCCGCNCGNEAVEDLDKETLIELSEALQEQLEKVNRRLAS